MPAVLAVLVVVPVVLAVELAVVPVELAAVPVVARAVPVVVRPAVEPAAQVVEQLVAPEAVRSVAAQLPSVA